MLMSDFSSFSTAAISHQQLPQLPFFVKKETTVTFHAFSGRVFETQRFVLGGCDFKIFSTVIVEMKALGRPNEEHLQQISLCNQHTQIYANANAL